MSVYKIKVNTLEEWENIVKDQNYDVSKAVVNKILENLHTKKRFIPILEIEINDNGEIYDITLDRKNMLNTLQVNLKIYEKYEDYEGCDSIIKAINTISSKR
jgi:cytidylate kinase